jgi:hypothetical protein
MAIYQPAAIALARQLGLDITAIQRERDDTAESQLIGAILADIGEPLAADTIATALGWTVDRLLDAAHGLRTQLRRIGQTVTISANHDLALAPYADVVSDALRADLHAAAIRIDDSAAALLHRIVTGRHQDRLASTLTDEERTIATHMIATERHWCDVSERAFAPALARRRVRRRGADRSTADRRIARSRRRTS